METLAPLWPRIPEPLRPPGEARGAMLAAALSLVVHGSLAAAAFALAPREAAMTGAVENVIEVEVVARELARPSEAGPPPPGAEQNVEQDALALAMPAQDAAPEAPQDAAPRPAPMSATAPPPAPPEFPGDPHAPSPPFDAQTAIPPPPFLATPLALELAPPAVAATASPPLPPPPSRQARNEAQDHARPAMEPARADAEQRAAERRELMRRQDPQKREANDDEAARREAMKREAMKREAMKREAMKRQAEKREAEKRQAMKREAKKRELDRRAAELRHASAAKPASRLAPRSQAAPSASGGAARSSGADVASFRAAVAARVAAMKRYPEGARARGETGRPVVAFVIASGGGLSGARLARSSGSRDLDAEALSMVRRAAPFPRPPAGAPRDFAIGVAFGLR